MRSVTFVLLAGITTAAFAQPKQKRMYSIPFAPSKIARMVLAPGPPQSKQKTSYTAQQLGEGPAAIMAEAAAVAPLLYSTQKPASKLYYTLFAANSRVVRMALSRKLA